MYGGEGWIVNDGGSAAGDGDFMTDIVGDFGVGEALEFIVDGDALAERFMDGVTEDIVEVGFTAEDDGKFLSSNGLVSFVNRNFASLAKMGRLQFCLFPKWLQFLIPHTGD